MGSDFKSIAGSDVAALYWLRRLAGEPLDAKDAAARVARDEKLAVDEEPDLEDGLAGRRTGGVSHKHKSEADRHGR